MAAPGQAGPARGRAAPAARAAALAPARAAAVAARRAPQAVVVHPVRPAAWGVSLGQQRKSMFNALLYQKHPQLYRCRIQPGPPWHYYRIAGALLGARLGDKRQQHRQDE